MSNPSLYVNPTKPLRYKFVQMKNYYKPKLRDSDDFTRLVADFVISW